MGGSLLKSRRQWAEKVGRREGSPAVVSRMGSSEGGTAAAGQLEGRSRAECGHR